MSDFTPRTIAVFGASGAQGRGVLAALRRDPAFRTRALTRTPSSFAGSADEIVRADLDGDEAELRSALAGAHGAFLVTNFWAPGTDEPAQVRRAVRAAKDAGVRHLVWSTLPDVAAISNGRFHVPHFTEKARANAVVAEAGFESFTFVEAPFYYQNLVGQMAPRDLGDGRKGWALPLEPRAEVVHMGDVSELDAVVHGAFTHPELVGRGETLAHAGECLSFARVVDILNGRGHSVAFQQVPAEVFATFFPGAAEMAQMTRYWQEFTYFGPDAERKIALARRVAGQAPTDFATWAARHLPVSGPDGTTS
jgi:uncharacterized protein YbjT (DUF2867 family)